MLATYTITARTDFTGFNIAIVATDGSRHTMLGFRTMAEAEAWIEADRRRDRWMSNSPGRLRPQHVPHNTTVFWPAGIA
jgi:hypothetical protein